MVKIIKVVTLVVATFLISAACLPVGKVLANTEAASSADIVMEKPDTRITQLKKFLDFYDSPLTVYAENFVKTADKYNLDWKLVPAITGVESTFGKAIPAGSYNAYGWANGAYWFTSWEDSIEIVGKTLKENYIDRGADTIEKIAPIYAPPSKTWAWRVRYFMEKIENFAPTSTLVLELSL